LDTPFPFPYAQILAILLMLLVFTCGYIMLAFVNNVIMVIALVGVAVGTFHGLNEVAKELEQPFGDDVNDLPMQEYQNNFNNRMQQLFYLGEDIYEGPGPSIAAIRFAKEWSNKNVPAQRDHSQSPRHPETLKLSWRKPIPLNDIEGMLSQRKRTVGDMGITM